MSTSRTIGWFFQIWFCNCDIQTFHTKNTPDLQLFEFVHDKSEYFKLTRKRCPFTQAGSWSFIWCSQERRPFSKAASHCHIYLIQNTQPGKTAIQQSCSHGYIYIIQNKELYHLACKWGIARVILCTVLSCHCFVLYLDNDCSICHVAFGWLMMYWLNFIYKIQLDHHLTQNSPVLDILSSHHNGHTTGQPAVAYYLYDSA